MKSFACHLALFMFAAVSLCAHAVDVQRDTVYFYDSWEQMLDMTPSSMIVSPDIEVINPYEIDIYTSTDDYRLYDHMAASIGDSIMLISSLYLRKNFKGDKHDFSSNKFYPVFFNEKVAYVVNLTYGEELSLKELLFGNLENDEGVPVYYYLDFMKRRVRKVTPSVLCELLEDYHDLQMRYEGMKNYKKHEIIEDYFFKYVDRASQDIMRPFIVDLVD